MLPGQHGAGQHRRERQRHNQRADEHQNHRQRHRQKHFAFHAFEREDRQIHDHDDQLPEHGGLSDFDGGFADDRLPGFGTQGAACFSWAMPKRRTMFSIITTELSTTMPKSIAPRLNKRAGDAESAACR